MEATSVNHAQSLPIGGPSPHLRTQPDERLIALARLGYGGAFEVLIARYRSALIGFCARILGSPKDAEDMVQDVFAAAYKAIRADDRPIAARPWLYQIARNRCLNELRGPREVPEGYMDPLLEGAWVVPASVTVDQREELRSVVADLRKLPETQRSALLLREVDELSYDQIAQVMETSVSGVKSLLVRARMSLAETAEARQLPCFQVRVELTRALEAFERPSAGARRHALLCPRCRSFKRELGRTGRALRAIEPIVPLAGLEAVMGGKAVGGSAGAGGSAGGSALGIGAAGGGGSAATAAAVFGGSAGLLKAAAIAVTAATLVFGGDAVIRNAQDGDPGGSSSSGAAAVEEPSQGGSSAAPAMDGWGRAASSGEEAQGAANAAQATAEDGPPAADVPAVAPPQPDATGSGVQPEPPEPAYVDPRADARAVQTEPSGAPSDSIVDPVGSRSADGPYRDDKTQVENEPDTPPAEPPGTGEEPPAIPPVGEAPAGEPGAAGS